jgi:GSH-dependent disulfide-bond oxidoreductase
MIRAYSWPTPNGHKVHIMLHECGLEHEIIPVNIGDGDQFKPEFLEISPNNRIPAIVDTDGPGGKEIAIFETGAILYYLAQKTGMFMPDAASDPAGHYAVMEWLMWQMGGIGPMMGQANHFRRYAPDRIEYATNRYANETKRLFGVADTRLGKWRYLAGHDYTIADIAAFPWMRNWKGQEVPLEEYPNTKRWLEEVGDRPAVKSGLEVLVEHRSSGLPKGKAWDVMFGNEQFKRR